MINGIERRFCKRTDNNVESRLKKEHSTDKTITKYSQGKQSTKTTFHKHTDRIYSEDSGSTEFKS